MKITAILNKKLGAGGGFDQGLNAVLQMQRLCAGRYDFEVGTGEAANLPVLAGLGITAHLARSTLADRLLARLNLSGLWHSLQVRLRWVGPLERQLIARGCSLVYYVSPDGGAAALQKLNHITTVWDLCHRDHPEFPEVRDFNEIFVRERHFGNNLVGASLVLTDSPALSATLAHRYGLDPQRLLAMPFAPSPFVGDVQAASADEVCRHYGLDAPYFFYPAQFWAHKNHIRILQALVILKAQGWTPRMVFSGKDYGNLAYLKAWAAEQGIDGQLHFIGFVAPEHMRGLYQAAQAVVMPTYFGPTNLPPLEAWALDKPLLYSAHLCGGLNQAALPFDADDAQALALALRQCTDAAVAEGLVRAGRQQLNLIDKQRAEAEAELLRKLASFAAKRSCWG